MTTEEKMEVMKAFIEGKTIQCNAVKYDIRIWMDDSNPCWDWNNFEYRVKPESNYRPYKNLEEFKKDIEKRYNDDFNMIIQNKNIWLKYKKTGGIYMISGFMDATFGIIINGGCYGFDMLFERYTYLDGSPCGIEG